MKHLSTGKQTTHDALQDVLSSSHEVLMLRASPTSNALQRLEWILLGFTGVTMVLMAPLLASPNILPQVSLQIVVLGVLRFRLPIRKLIDKVLYIGLELFILVLPTFIDGRIYFLPFLGLVIVIRGCQMFKLPGRIAVAGLTFTAFVWNHFGMGRSGPFAMLKVSEQSKLGLPSAFDPTSLTLRLNAALSFGLAVAFVLLLINALLEECQSREKLLIAHNQLRHYALRIEDQSTLQERNRIAREIHDLLGHTLTAQSIQLDSALLLFHSDAERANCFLQTAKQLCTQALQEVRQSVATLRTDPLQGKSLKGAIAALIEDFRVTTAIEPTCTIHLDNPLPPEILATVYRILQEALTNIIRHSNATEINIQVFDYSEGLHMLVKDNGQGFDPEQNSTGYGIQGMRERTVALGGRFNLFSELGSGCLITIQIPLVRYLNDSVTVG